MAKNLLESYKNRLAVADALYARNHNGAKMDNYKKLLIANAMDNVSNFLTEAFENSAGTQRAAIGDYKRFCMTLTNLAIPSMIAPEIVLTVPMASRTGYITYINYTAGSHKGGVKRGDLFNGVYALGQMTEDRARYTGNAVVEAAAHTTGSDTAVTLAWNPVYSTIEVLAANGTPLTAGTDYTVSSATGVDKRWTKDTVGSTSDPNTDTVASSALLTNSVDVAPNTVPTDAKAVVVTIKSATGTGTYRIKYLYDNIVIPQNDIPQLNAEMAEITLTAHARRIAVYYSQIANFQAKTDYGFDLGENLAKQAIGELQYEIDSEVIAGLRAAINPTSFAAHTWSKTQPVGVSLVEHYQGFAKMFDELATEVYLATQKFSPNYMVCARDVVTVLSFLNGWQAAPLGQVNGPYFAGSYNGVKVYVSPMLATGEFFVGVNGSDMMTSAAVYGIYMPVVPTQLLGFADGGMSQGFSTLYDFQILSKDANGYSPLLAGGQIVA